MTPDALAEIIAEDRREWALLCEALDGHPEGALHDLESPEWTARDVYTHLAAMMEGSSRLIEEYLSGQPHRRMYEGADEDDTNARIRDQHALIPLEEARAWANRAFEGMILAIQLIPLDSWDKRFESYAHADGSKHIRAHREWIRE